MPLVWVHGVKKQGFDRARLIKYTKTAVLLLSTTDSHSVDYDDDDFKRMVREEEERILREDGDRLRKDAEKVC